MYEYNYANNKFDNPFIYFRIRFLCCFKKYEEDDDIMGGISTLTVIELVLGVLLFISERFG